MSDPLPPTYVDALEALDLASPDGGEVTWSLDLAGQPEAVLTVTLRGVPLTFQVAPRGLPPQVIQQPVTADPTGWSG